MVFKGMRRSITPDGNENNAHPYDIYIYEMCTSKGKKDAKHIAHKVLRKRLNKNLTKEDNA